MIIKTIKMFVLETFRKYHKNRTIKYAQLAKDGFEANEHGLCDYYYEKFKKQEIKERVMKDLIKRVEKS